MIERTFGYGPKPDVSRLRLFTGNSNVELVKDRRSSQTRSAIDGETFSDGEINVESMKRRGMDIFIVQSLSFPVNNNLMGF